jgi:hypothetical protein
VATSEDLEILARSGEVMIETQSDERVHRTVIWVADSDGAVYVRSVRGDEGKWYQRALAHPDVALIAGATRVEFRAVPSPDSASIARASQGFRAKYRGPSLDAMLASDVLHTTMRLDPKV